MKFLVDEMPAYWDDCPFYKFSCTECSLDREHCDYFDQPFRERSSECCRFLTLAKSEGRLNVEPK